MTHSARISQQRAQRLGRNRNTVVHRNKHQLGPVSHALLIGLILTGLGLLYLVQITRTSVYGFEVNTLRQTHEQLSQQNQTLQVEAARLQSLERIESSELVKQFEPADDLGYLPE